MSEARTEEEAQAWEERVRSLAHGLLDGCAGYTQGQALAALVEVACQVCEQADMAKADFLIKVTEHWEKRLDQLKEEEDRGNRPDRPQ
jgi:hypothetical protein